MQLVFPFHKNIRPNLIKNFKFVLAQEEGSELSSNVGDTFCSLFHYMCKMNLNWMNSKHTDITPRTRG